MKHKTKGGEKKTKLNTDGTQSCFTYCDDKSCIFNLGLRHLVSNPDCKYYEEGLNPFQTK